MTAPGQKATPFEPVQSAGCRGLSGRVREGLKRSATNHPFNPEKIAWFDVADDLPRYRGFDSDSDVSRRGPASDDLPG